MTTRVELWHWPKQTTEHERILSDECIRRGQIAPSPGDQREEALAREAQKKRVA